MERSKQISGPICFNTPQEVCEIDFSSTGVKLPALGISLSITYVFIVSAFDFEDEV